VLSFHESIIKQSFPSIVEYFDRTWLIRHQFQKLLALSLRKDSSLEFRGLGARYDPFFELPDNSRQAVCFLSFAHII
jgi:hypothetical protein